MRGFLLAALVHDLGHYPFAHVVEQYASGRFPENREIATTASHEQHTISMLDEDPELHALMEEHWGSEAILQAKKVLLGQTGLSLLLDGPLDVDKLDYLSRDARHCGVVFGEGLDARQVLQVLRFDPRSRSFHVSARGIAPVEGMLVLQDQMLGEVYWHEVVRGVIAMFHAVFAHCVGTDSEKFTSLVSDLKSCRSEADAIAKVINPAIDQYKSGGRGPDGQDTKDRLKELSGLLTAPVYRSVYRPIATYRPDAAAHKASLSNIYNSLFRAVTSSSRTSAGIVWQKVGELRESFLKAMDEKDIRASKLDVVIDIPCGKNPRKQIMVFDEEEQTEKDLASVSHLRESIFSQPAAFWSPVRVYVHPRLFEQIRSRVESIKRSAEELYSKGMATSESEFPG
ncbi:MAG: HD domain-containing protein [Planctomycetaceae bacterium]